MSRDNEKAELVRLARLANEDPGDDEGFWDAVDRLLDEGGKAEDLVKPRREREN